jgi:hypothetical protein
MESALSQRSNDSSKSRTRGLYTHGDAVVPALREIMVLYHGRAQPSRQDIRAVLENHLSLGTPLERRQLALRAIYK